MKFHSQMTVGADLAWADQATIKNEPMLHRATATFAVENGGSLTRHFLYKLAVTTNQWEDVLIDSRVHMLMPGMFPCIPGWHHDDVPRSRSDGQPDYYTPAYRSDHCMALWGDASLTEFAVGEQDFDIPPVGKKIYKELSPQVEEMCVSGKLIRRIAPECKLIFFDYQAWHQGAPATKTGFRFFIRATRFSSLKSRNEIRVNANVYLPVLDEGW